MPELIRIGFEPTAEELERLKSFPALLHLEPAHPSYQILLDHGAAVHPFESGSLPEDAILVVPEPAISSLEQLVHVARRLLGPGGCPWDQEQTHQSLKRHLLEETYEVIEVIDSGNSGDFCEELGDLLLQPVMHAEMSARDGGFGMEEVARGIVAKLIRRHPHVFGDTVAADASAVLQNWDAIKKKEKGEPQSILEGVPKALPALLRAYEISVRAARAGFEWPDRESVFEKLEEERAELREALLSGDAEEIEAELGDLLFTVVNIARWCSVEPEDALRKMLDRFQARFMTMESLATKPLPEYSLEEWETLWQQAKSIVRAC